MITEIKGRREGQQRQNVITENLYKERETDRHTDKHK